MWILIHFAYCTIITIDWMFDLCDRLSNVSILVFYQDRNWGHHNSNTCQVYELWWQVVRLWQADGSLEKFYTELQGLWQEIDFRSLNVMKFTTNIDHYDNLLQENHVYTSTMVSMITSTTSVVMCFKCSPFLPSNKLILMFIGRLSNMHSWVLNPKIPLTRFRPPRD